MWGKKAAWRGDRPPPNAQVRVMPRCWFALLRFWLRVDGVLVRLYEARLMAELGGRTGAPLVRRELRRCEGDFAQLAAAGAPPARVRHEGLPQGPSFRASPVPVDLGSVGARSVPHAAGSCAIASGSVTAGAQRGGRRPRQRMNRWAELSPDVASRASWPGRSPRMRHPV
jgi:hypothetical protein